MYIHQFIISLKSAVPVENFNFNFNFTGLI